jgi:hypothetical protein
MADTPPKDPFVKLPAELIGMVADGRLSITAAWLYVLLLSHVNYKRRDGKVWPSRKTLATKLQLKTARAVDRYVTELTKAGLIERERRVDGKANDTNMYTLAVVCWPPEDATDPEGGSAPQSTRGGALANTRGSAPQNTGVVLPRAPELDRSELDRSELDEEELDQPSLSAGHEPTVAASSVNAPQPREREADFSDHQFPTMEHRILAKYGWLDKQADHLIKALTERYDIWGTGWWITADKNGTLPERIQELADEEIASKPDWTGQVPVNGRWPAHAAA